jgi:hypothetical protein
MDQEYQELEKKKLQLEIRELDRPYHLRPTFWISIASVVIALVGVFGQSYLSNIKSERTELEVAQSRKELKKLRRTVLELRSTESDILEFLANVTKGEQIPLIDPSVNWPNVKEQLLGMPPGRRKQALLIALLYAWKDIPFTLGGKSLKKGFDSPSFLARVLNDVGVNFKKKPGILLSELMISQLKKIDSPRPGDIAFYKGQVGNFGALLLATDDDKKNYVGVGTFQKKHPLQVITLKKIYTNSYPLVGYFSVNYPDESR